jgi:hypothetical protein
VIDSKSAVWSQKMQNFVGSILSSTPLPPSSPFPPHHAFTFSHAIAKVAKPLLIETTTKKKSLARTSNEKEMLKSKYDFSFFFFV